MGFVELSGREWGDCLMSTPKRLDKTPFPRDGSNLSSIEGRGGQGAGHAHIVKKGGGGRHFTPFQWELSDTVKKSSITPFVHRGEQRSKEKGFHS